MKFTTAEELNGQWIGRVIRFDWQFPVSDVWATVWGELREVHHDGADTTVHLNNTAMGDKTEFVLDPGQPVERVGE